MPSVAVVVVLVVMIQLQVVVLADSLLILSVQALEILLSGWDLVVVVMLMELHLTLITHQ
jgi:hypothetical protein